MRLRAVATFVLFAVPSVVLAQAIRRPRTDPRSAGQPEPASLPPEIAPVSRDLAMKRSHLSVEGYTLVNSVRAPGSGGVSNHSELGSGTHADYRVAQHFSTTLDVTTALFGGGGLGMSGTVEAGTRYSPLSWSSDLRPFFDVRAAYLRSYDSFVLPNTGAPGVGGSAGEFLQEQRYGHGFGSVGGAGFEYTLTNSLALTTEFAGMRSRMTAYRLTGPATIPVGSSYWQTSFRYIIGFKYNRVTALHLDQNSRHLDQNPRSR
jgi:hypothetical protein